MSNAMTGQTAARRSRARAVVGPTGPVGAM